ncbi:UNKNOWN [Stylonychia lemnae]|uniref:Uncharacterized protein n=1 Tax=Stylonychia lemnae TaxID=5949 RepID=A0A078AHE1_STYLE|nr:UNKNOWN [Stylonychia lemnae]|eukprot:CDW81261.1 UNKNOWN [Stylonychia lemnae]
MLGVIDSKSTDTKVSWKYNNSAPINSQSKIQGFLPYKEYIRYRSPHLTGSKTKGSMQQTLDIDWSIIYPNRKTPTRNQSDENSQQLANLKPSENLQICETKSPANSPIQQEQTSKSQVKPRRAVSRSYLKQLGGALCGNTRTVDDKNSQQKEEEKEKKSIIEDQQVPDQTMLEIFQDNQFNPQYVKHKVAKHPIRGPWSTSMFREPLKCNTKKRKLRQISTVDLTQNEKSATEDPENISLLQTARQSDFSFHITQNSNSINQSRTVDQEISNSDNYPKKIKFNDEVNIMMFEKQPLGVPEWTSWDVEIHDHIDQLLQGNDHKLYNPYRDPENPNYNQKPNPSKYGTIYPSLDGHSLFLDNQAIYDKYQQMVTQFQRAEIGGICDPEKNIVIGGPNSAFRQYESKCAANLYAACNSGQSTADTSKQYEMNNANTTNANPTGQQNDNVKIYYKNQLISVLEFNRIRESIDLNDVHFVL